MINLLVKYTRFLLRCVHQACCAIPSIRCNSCVPHQVKFNYIPLWGQALFLALGLAAPVIAVFDFGIQRREASKVLRDFHKDLGNFTRRSRFNRCLDAVTVGFGPSPSPTTQAVSSASLLLHRLRYRSPWSMVHVRTPFKVTRFEIEKLYSVRV